VTWTKDEIHTARTRQLAPILTSRGYQLAELPSGALIVPSIKGLVILGHTWYWAPQNLKGNTIDFFMTLEAKTFTDTMQILCPKNAQPAASAQKDPRKYASPAPRKQDRDYRPFGKGCLDDPDEQDQHDDNGEENDEEEP
jgi:hypothetical protein